MKTFPVEFQILDDENEHRLIGKVKGFDEDSIELTINDFLLSSNEEIDKLADILKRVFSFGKPFALLMNTNGLFDSQVRWDLFSKNDFSLFYLKGRVNYMKEYGKVEKSSPPFQSAYITSKLFNSKIVFES